MLKSYHRNAFTGGARISIFECDTFRRGRKMWPERYICHVIKWVTAVVVLLLSSLWGSELATLETASVRTCMGASIHHRWVICFVGFFSTPLFFYLEGNNAYGCVCIGRVIWLGSHSLRAAWSRVIEPRDRCAAIVALPDFFCFLFIVSWTPISCPYQCT